MRLQGSSDNGAVMSMVTVALPCYNAERTVGNTVRSILAQTFEDWELLALDDGSTDGTVEVLKAFGDERIRVISDGTNRGRCFRLNQAAELAKGKYYARMDSDDLMFPERLAKQVAFLEENPDVDLLGAGLVSIDETLAPKGMRLAPARVESAYQIFRGEVLYHPTVTGKTDWFREHAYIEGYVYSDDFACWTKHAAGLRIANLQEPLLFYLEDGPFTYDKYLGRRKETRKAIGEHGPAIIGDAATRALLRRRKAKDAVYALLNAMGLWSQTTRLINNRLSRDATESYGELLARIIDPASEGK